MGRITIDNLSASLKTYMQTLGLTEEQVIEVVNRVLAENSTEELQTDNKTIVGAINELFQNVDSGKQLIADAIDDENITKDSSFSAMSEAIANNKTQVNVELENIRSIVNNIDTKLQSDSDLKNRLVEKLVAIGVDVTVDDSIDVIFNIIENLILAKGNATVRDVLLGKTFSNEIDGLLTGEAPTNSNATVTPGSSKKTLSYGYYPNGIIISGDSKLIAGNIKSGVTIFGVKGTF